MQFLKRLKPMVAALQNSSANTIYVDTDDESIKVGTGASGSTERTVADSLSGGHFPDGTSLLPAVTGTDLDTGLYFTSNVVRVAANAAAVGSWASVGIAANSLLLDFTNQDVSLSRRAAYNPLFASTSNAYRLDVANTYTSNISNEVFSVDWQTTANVGLTGTRTAATGTSRDLRLVAQAASGANVYGVVNISASAPFVRLDRTTATLTTLNDGSTGNWFQIGGGDVSTATSGTIAHTAILPSYNQASGNAANTDLLIQRTQTAVGSGNQFMIQAGTAASPSLFTVSNGGAIYADAASQFAGGVATPAGGSTSAKVTMGTAAVGIYWGTNVPTVSAAKGSLYIQTDATTTTTRLYINTNGTTTWTNFTAAA